MLYLDQLQRLSKRAAEAGCVTHSVMTREWDVSADCERPVTREMFARPSRRQHESKVVIWRGSLTPLRVIIHARCRECPRCLRHRSRLWTARARFEARISVRNWFGTITLAPRWQQHCLDVARRDCARQGVDFDGLSDQERFRLRHKVVSAELTRWLKRVRKNSGGAPLRFLLVAEAHKSGAPHYHIILHERDPAKPVRHAVLKAAWLWGFTKFNLLEDSSAVSYATKYLSKSVLARVRASIRYGNENALEPSDDQRSSVKKPDHQKSETFIGTEQSETE